MINEQGHIVLDADGGKVLRTMKEVDNAARQLKGTLRSLEFGSDQFKKTTTAIQELNREKTKLNATLSGTNKLWENIKTQMIGVGAVALGFLGFQMITAQLGNMIRKNAELSDSLAMIRQKTGMTQAEVEKLNSAFGKFDTRTATKELRSIATELGQLGIGKDKIEETTKAIDKLSVALEGEFANAAEVTRVTGTLRNILTDIRSDRPDQDMMHLGNALLELGNAGLATAPVVSEIATRIGGIGVAMGLTSGQVLGISATLQELGLTAERGGTATGRILLKMTKNVADFAVIAGVPVAQFTKMLNTDLYGAFKQVMVGSQKSAESATALATLLKDAELSGAGASEVFLKLGKNAGLMDEKVTLASKALGETDKIMSSFALKNETFGAKLDKLGKAIYNVMANSGITRFFEGMVDGLLKITDKTTDAEKAVNAFNKAADDYKNTSEKINPLLDRYDVLSLQSIRSKDEQDELQKIIEKVAQTIPYAVSAFDSLGNAMDINSGKAREYIEDMKTLMKLHNKDAIKEQTDLLKDAEVEMIQQGRKRIHMQEELLKMDERYEDFKRSHPDSSKFSKSDIQNVVSYKSAREQLMEQKKAEDRLWNESNAKKLDAEKNIRVLSGDISSPGTTGVFAKKKKEDLPPIGPTPEEFEKAKKALEDYLNDTAKLTQDLRTAQAQSIDDETQREVALAKVRYENNLDDLKQYEATIIAKRKAGIPLTEEEKKREVVLTELKLQTLEEYQRKAKDIIDKFNKKLADDEFKTTIENLENTQATRRNLLKTQYINGQIDKKAYDDKIFAMEQQDLRERKTAYKDYGKDVTDIDEKITDGQIKNADEVAKAQTDAANKAADEWKKFFKETEKLLQNYGKVMTDIYGSFFDIESSKDEKNFREKRKQNETAIEDARKKSQEEIAIADEQYSKGAISKEKYDAIKAQSEQELSNIISGLNSNLDKQQRQMAYDQAVRDKIMAEFEAAINGALAVIAALAVPGIGPALAIATGIAVAAQMAAIAARPLPELAAGGSTDVEGKSGKRHRVNYTGSIAGGGVYDTPSLGILGEAGAEYVIPNWIYTMPKMANVMGAIEAMRQRGSATAGNIGASGGGSGSEGNEVKGAVMMLMVATNKLIQRLDDPINASLNYDRLNYDLNKIGQALDTGKIRSAD